MGRALTDETATSARITTSTPEVIAVSPVRNPSYLLVSRPGMVSQPLEVVRTVSEAGDMTMETSPQKEQ